MDDASGDPESKDHAHFLPLCAPPWSGRELSALQLELSRARTDADKKHIMETSGTTVEELNELHGFDIDLVGGDATDDD
ncbi:hypothetical protein [Streptomyces sp. NPDC003943]